MINFEEELKKFHPSLEIDEAEDVIINHNLTDFTDILEIDEAEDVIINHNLTDFTDILVEMVRDHEEKEKANR